MKFLLKAVGTIFKILVALLIIAAGLTALLVLQAMRQAEEQTSIEEIQQEKGITVKVARPSRMDFVEYLMCDGVGDADNRTMLRAQVGEIVEAVHAKVGERVKKDQLLVEFRTEDLEASLEAAKTAYEEAENNYKRYRSLHEKGHVTAQALEQRRTALNQAEAALRQARSRMTFAKVYSPLDGIVEGRFVEPGEFKGIGKQLLQIVDLSDVLVKARVPEDFVSRLQAGDEGEYRLEGRESWDEATIVRISPSTMNPNRFFDVYMRPEGQNKSSSARIRPGMYSEVRFARRRVESALSIPRNSVRTSGQDNYVLKVVSGLEKVPVQTETPESQKEKTLIEWVRIALGKYIPRIAPEKPETRKKPETRQEKVLRVRRVPVELGLRGNGSVQVASGSLTADDRVILNPVDDLTDGDKVRIEEGEVAAK